MAAVKEQSGLTAKQEAFAQAYVELGSAAEAYRHVYAREGTKILSINRMAHKMVHHPPIAARIAELRKAALARHNVTIDRIVHELALIGFSNMLDYVTVQPDGTAYVDLSKLTRAQAAAIGELTVETYTEGRGDDAREVKRVRFKLSDKQGALEKLGRHLGMFPTQVQGKIEHDHKHDHEHRTVSDTARWLEDVLGAGPGRPPQESLPN